MRNRFSGTMLCLALSLIVCCVCSAAQAQTYTYRSVRTLKQPRDPYHVTSLILDPVGNLYGTSFYGGADNVGTVFKVTSQGSLTVLHSFSSSFGGELPWSLALDSRGNLYGATPYIRGEFDYNATIFKMAAEPQGKYNFGNLWSQGYGPQALAVDSAKNIYGVVQPYAGIVSGGCGSCLFQISETGTFTDLWDFDYINFDPLGALVVDKSGDVFGTIGGDGGSSSWGYVFEWSPTAGYSVLHEFNGSDGYYPNALVQDAAGNLYGTTAVGGANGYGTAFTISAAGAFSTLHDFCSLPNCADGEEPNGTLAVDSSGNLYGTITYSSPKVYKLTPSGTESVIYSGPTSVGSLLVIDKSGNLYGVDSLGVYELIASK
jgi:uncharacterized repeat protein (TIGR03803 family)